MTQLVRRFSKLQRSLSLTSINEQEDMSMITIKLGEKNYHIDFISGRALRELEPAAKMYARIVSISNAAIKGEEIPESETLTISEAMDVMVKWFCLVFGNQFTPDELLDSYPVDRLMHDIALTLMAVQTQTTSILSEFPTKAAPDQPKPTTETNPETTAKNETAI